MPVTTLKNVININANLAPSQLTVLDIPNKNTLLLKDLLQKHLSGADRGIEVGSVNYVNNSSHYFMRAKALQFENYLPFFDSDTIVPIRPQVFVNLNLKKGDLIISKDSNIGECILLDKDYPNHMLSGALYKLPIEKNKYYIFAFLKHPYFRNQLDLMVPKGSTIRHAKTLFLNCKIPFPKQSDFLDVIEYVELLVRAIFNKEISIREKSQAIYDSINTELIDHQKMSIYTYNYPKYKTIKNNNRIDAGIYSEYLCRNDFRVRNYKYGYSNIKHLNFNINRGQNLQVSCIGTSIYSKIYQLGFYTVIKPMHISTFGTDFSREYLGNPKNLKVLKKGDIIFGAEGFEKGRSMVIVDDKIKTITNIHGIVLHHSDNDIVLSVFVKCFLDYLRKIGLIDLFAVGGNGGSLAMKYWDVIPIPKFNRKKQEQIAEMYHNINVYPKNILSNNFLEKDDQWNKISGIIEIDKSIKLIKNHLNCILNNIIQNKKIKIDFSFLSRL